MATLMAQSQVREKLKRIPEWELHEKEIERTFEWDDFNQAMDFVNAVAELANEANHHPDLDIRWNKVRVALYTHSAGGVTELDFQLAEKVDMLEE